MTDLYKAADLSAANASDESKPEWITVQKLAFGTTLEDRKKLEQIIQKTSQASVRLPVPRTATVSQDCPFGHVEAGQTVILDLVSSPMQLC